VERYFHRYPGVRHYMDNTRAQASEQGFVETPRFVGRGRGIEFIAEAETVQVMFDYKTGKTRAVDADFLAKAKELIEKAEAAFDQKTQQEQTERMLKGQFTLEDYAQQLKQLRKMGSLQQVMDMLPGGMGQAMKNVSADDAEAQLRRVEAIIGSMTLKERRNPDLLNASRRRRIASGSGTDVQDVNRMIKQFRDAQRMIKTLQKTGGRGLSRMFK